MSTENVLQGILSQKIVQDGGGYVARTDIVNVDNITATGDIVAASITTNGPIEMTGDISSDGSITANNLNLTSITGPHISSTRNSIRISTLSASGNEFSQGTFDLGNNLIISSRAVDSGGLVEGRVTMGAELDMKGQDINDTVVNQFGGIKFGKNITLNEHRLIDGSIKVSNCKNFGSFEDAIQFDSKAITASAIWYPPISNILGQFNIKTNCGQITIDNSSGTSLTFAYQDIEGITSSSIVVVTPTSDLGTYSGNIPITYWVETTGNIPTQSSLSTSGRITIRTSHHVEGIKTFNYFIAKYY